MISKISPFCHFLGQFQSPPSAADTLVLRALSMVILGQQLSSNSSQIISPDLEKSLFIPPLIIKFPEKEMWLFNSL